jgi:hypothetical protein
MEGDEFSATRKSRFFDVMKASTAFVRRHADELEGSCRTVIVQCLLNNVKLQVAMQSKVDLCSENVISNYADVREKSSKQHARARRKDFMALVLE